MEWTKVFGKIKEKHWLGFVVIIAAILRLWQLDRVPASMFGDELDVGYQAFSILKTGRDYYGNFMPLHFHSLAEWRTPLYLYTTVPFVAIFGISPWGVRLPAALFGIFSIIAMFYLVREISKNGKLALWTSFVMAISPWHIQYSRAGFEVTQLLFFLILGIYLFFKALGRPNLLWVSVVSLLLAPWTYSTAKVFVPLLMLFLFVLYYKDIFKMPKKSILVALLAAVVVGGPMAWDVLFGGGAQRFGYIGVFSNPVTEHEVGVGRLNDAKMRGEKGIGISPKFVDRVMHNKYNFWLENIVSNYLQAFSTDFLFVRGDPNLRHSIKGTGQMYRIEIVALLIGLVYFFGRKERKKLKYLIGLWILVGVIPAAMTRDGGNHASRLIIILPPLMLLTAYGMLQMRFKMLGIYLGLLLINFIIYSHGFWIHNPWNSERWWHSGFGEAINEIKKVEGQYERVVISTASEPPWIFFAGWYEYDPGKWQREFPIGRDVDLPGFGRVSHIDKFYFGSPGVGLYEMGGRIDSKTLYLASEKEVNVNLIAEPERLPNDLVLIKSFAYPSGEPVLYLFTGKNK
ncbi:hypothetical protein A2382_00535 [Candidatus Woesebacteria bacterium RIFOXYB1_FULL_38_16]|uniref:Glycosyltransferase RgtA/B/C/D-like domain-containing protein n=1 Tax=Candidatus Woesebacteria bacterium RIFOXYB1_FULL_38_16 TaxID=1802538 RepID=A0A1F8CSE3_9BACT|nr:MAG: hypothetical protein A2191_01415 [Candidatus Woesebacteria bacterium RIFOXYA1_FULL_38_9]OGM79257.1 MAG: hypothetical protein A2382_00535 [Candidatus Woesebacteria bacterium RIFOXYB1_FULL_38_16]